LIKLAIPNGKSVTAGKETMSFDPVFLEAGSRTLEYYLL